VVSKARQVLQVPPALTAKPGCKAQPVPKVPKDKPVSKVPLALALPVLTAKQALLVRLVLVTLVSLVRLVQ
jgi:hypothetical protein